MRPEPSLAWARSTGFLRPDIVSTRVMAGQVGHCWDWGSGAGVLVSVAAVAGGEAGVCAGAVEGVGGDAALAPGCRVPGGSLGAHAANRSAPISAQTLQKALVFIFCCSFSSRSRRIRASAMAERTVREQPPAFPAPYSSCRWPAEARLHHGCDQVQGQSSYQQSCLTVQFYGCSRWGSIPAEADGRHSSPALLGGVEKKTVEKLASSR